MKLNDVLKLDNENISELALREHVDKHVPLYESIFRIHSENYYAVFNKARELRDSGELSGLDHVSDEMLDSDIGKTAIYEGSEVYLDTPFIAEAEYQGKDVELNKPKRGGSKKFYVYTKNDKGNVIKVEFGAEGGGQNLAVKLKDPEARKAFAARHNCEQKNDKTKAGYWACRLPRFAKSLGLEGSGTWW